MQGGDPVLACLQLAFEPLTIYQRAQSRLQGVEQDSIAFAESAFPGGSNREYAPHLPRQPDRNRQQRTHTGVDDRQVHHRLALLLDLGQQERLAARDHARDMTHESIAVYSELAQESAAATHGVSINTAGVVKNGQRRVAAVKPRRHDLRQPDQIAAQTDTEVYRLHRQVAELILGGRRPFGPALTV